MIYVPAKKENLRFTIQFNAGDPHHQQVAELLNKQGRRKAQFIVSAVTHYINCTETPEVAVPHVPDRKMLEEMVREILAALSAEPQPKADLDGSKCKHTEIDIAANELLDEEGISALLGSLAAIQGL